MDAGPIVRGRAGYFAILVTATFLMGSSFIVGKILLADGIPAFLLVGWRFFVAAFAALPLVFATSVHPRADLFPPRFRRRDWLVVTLIGLLQTGGAMGLIFLAMETISPSTAAILLFTNPIWVALFGRLFLGEVLSAVRLLGLFFGLAGVALAMGIGGGEGTRPNELMGELTGLAAALCWATSTTINKRAAVPMPAWALTFWQMLIGAVTLLVFAYARGEHWPAATTLIDWLWFFWLAIPGSTLSFGLWFLALRRGGATRSSGYLFLAPLFAVLLSAFFLGAHLSAAQIAGGLLVGSSLWLVNRQPR